MIFFPATKLIGKNQKRGKYASEASSTRIKIHEHETYDGEGHKRTYYTPYYYYNVDGKEYVCRSESGSDKNNGRNKVYYNPDDPSECMTQYTEEDNFLDILIFWVGVFSLLMTIIALVKTKKKTGNFLPKY